MSHVCVRHLAHLDYCLPCAKLHYNRNNGGMSLEVDKKNAAFML
jgi:hypothetical protein